MPRISFSKFALLGMVIILIGGSARGQELPAESDPPGEVVVPETLEARISRLIDDLRDDDIKWNAQDAIDELSKIGMPAVPALEAALDSPDWQLRQMAAFILRDDWRYRSSFKEYQPSTRLLEVCVEGLRHDDLPWEGRSWRPYTITWVSNAKMGVPYLIKHAKAAELFLVKALKSEDVQQRFLVAVVLGMAGRTASLEQTVRILLPHLQNNNISDDARMATPALYHLGKAVLPYLMEALPSADDQQEQLIRLIWLDLIEPAVTKEEKVKRSHFNTITQNCIDPALSVGEWDLGYRDLHRYDGD